MQERLYTDEAWTSFWRLAMEIRPDDPLTTHGADFAAAHIAELARPYLSPEQHYDNLSNLHRALRTERTGRTILRNRVLIAHEMPADFQPPAVQS